MRKANTEVLKSKGFIPNWKIAQKLGIHEITLIRWLRTELTEEKKLKVLSAIEEVKKEQELED